MMDFMDTLKRGVDRAGFEVDRFLRANRVKSQVGALRTQVDEESRQIGQQLFELYRRGEPVPEAVRDYCERIGRYQEEIRQKELELEAINREVSPQGEEESREVESTEGSSCPHCGSTLPEDAIYCPRCGANLKAAPPDQPA